MGGDQRSLHQAYVVSFGAEMVNSESDKWCYTSVEFRSGDPDGGPSTVLYAATRVNRIANRVAGAGKNNSSHSRAMIEPLNGIEVSGEAHMRLMHRVSGGVGTFSNRWLLVQPAVNIQDDGGPE